MLCRKAWEFESPLRHHLNTLQTGLPMHASHRLGVLTDLQLQRALDQFDLGTLISAEPIPFGLFGQNVHVTSTAGEFVLRGAPHFEWQLPTEQFFAHVIRHETTVPVPWPYHMTTQSGQFDWPWGFAIMPRMPGQALAAPGIRRGLTHSQWSALAVAQAEVLGILQQASSPFPGTYDIVTSTIRPLPEGYVARTVERALANARAALANGSHGEADHAWLEAVLEKLRALPEPDSFCLVHEDFNHNNMMANIDGNSVTITGLLDLMTCHYGDGLADLARQVSIYLADPGDPAVTRAFVGSYLTLRPAFTSLDFERSVLYLIDERLLAWEYATRPGHEHLDWWDRSTTLRAWLESYIDRWNELVSPYLASGGMRT
jgi:hygromycin-B 7''-O-kinase